MAGQYLDGCASSHNGAVAFSSQVTPEVADPNWGVRLIPDNRNGKAEGQGWSLDAEHADGVTFQ